MALILLPAFLASLLSFLPSLPLTHPPLSPTLDSLLPTLPSHPPSPLTHPQSPLTHPPLSPSLPLTHPPLSPTLPSHPPSLSPTLNPLSPTLPSPFDISNNEKNPCSNPGLPRPMDPPYMQYSHLPAHNRTVPTRMASRTWPPSFSTWTHGERRPPSLGSRKRPWETPYLL